MEEKQELIRAFHMTWDNYPEQVRLIDRNFRILAGNRAYLAAGGETGGKCNVGDPAMHRGCQAMAALKTGETKINHTEINGTPFDSYWVPVAGDPDCYIHFTNGLNALIAMMAQQPEPPKGE